MIIRDLIMAQDEFLYRYREISKHNLKALRNNAINGSLFKKLGEQEARYKLSDNYVHRAGFTEDEAKSFVRIIIDNTYNNYYLASFTKERPTTKNLKWIDFAKEKGYCLVYRKEDIANQIEKDVWKETKIIQLLNVNYSNSYFYLDFIAKRLLHIIGKYDIKTVEDLDNRFLEEDWDSRRKVSEAFAHKLSCYRSEKEVRIVLQGKIPNSDFCNEMIHVAPMCVLIPSYLKFYEYVRIVETARVVGVQIQFMEVDIEYIKKKKCHKSSQIIAK